MAKNVYIICPVRELTDEDRAVVEADVAEQERLGHNVHFPLRDVNQNDPTGFHIVSAHKAAMRMADVVRVFWKESSKGSHVDLGMALALDKPLELINDPPRTPGKSYTNDLRIRAGLDPQP